MRRSAKCWLVIIALILLTPIFSAAQQAERSRGCGKYDRNDRKCRQVPDGGSGAIYLLGIGVSCLGATLIRSRRSKS
jgi:hypothetical protein